MWIKQVNDLPLYRRILLFSFFMTLVVVVATAGFTFFYQTKQMTNQLSEQAKGIASLWSVTIPPEDVKAVSQKRDINDSAMKGLTRLVDLIHERNADYLQGYLIDVKKNHNNEIVFLAVNKTYKEMGIHSFSTYKASKEYIESYSQAVQNKKETTSEIFRDQYGIWLTAFQPIIDEKGNVVAVLGVDVDASIIDDFQQKIGLFLIYTLLIITLLVYFTLRWGLRKVLEPVQEIISGINAVSSGDFDVKVRVSKQSEMVQLGEKFNYMTSQLTVLFERLAETYKEFGSYHLGSVHKVEEAIDEMEKIIAKTRLQKELQRAEKMNAIGQLAASVAHEIRNPMTVVRGFLQMFLTHETFTPTELTFVQLMIDELNRAENIINDYLSLAKPDLDRIEKVDAADLTHKVADLMNTFAFMSKNITLQTNFETDVYVKGNHSELKQVIINIVKNGIEAMRSGGILTLSVEKSGKYGLFTVTDQGIGMTPDELKRLGTAFYSLKEKGTGIGLMVCYQLVEKMRGRIDVTSERGVGTTFQVFIPLWDGEIE